MATLSSESKKMLIHKNYTNEINFLIIYLSPSSHFLGDAGENNRNTMIPRSCVIIFIVTIPHVSFLGCPVVGLNPTLHTEIHVTNGAAVL